MEDFLNTLYSCERAGLEFLQDGSLFINEYDITLTLEPNNHAISIEGTVGGTILSDGCDEARFLLGLNVMCPGFSNCRLTMLSFEGCKLDYEADGYRYLVPLGRSFNKNDHLRFSISYTSVPLARKCWVNSVSEGPVPGLGDGETELCYEGYWLPFADPLFQPVSGTISIVHDPKTNVIFNGRLIGKNEDREMMVSTFKTYLPTFPTLIAGNFVKIERRISGATRIVFYHQEGYAAAATGVLDRAEKVLQYLVNLFGSNPVREFSLVQLQRTSFGQYAPFPMVVIPRDDVSDREDSEYELRLNSMLGHEISHFWFGGLLRSLPHENWLSEGFAQYMSTLVVEHFHGPETMSQVMEKYADTLSKVDHNDQAPLWNIPMSHPHQQMIVRVKGALVLHLLRQRVGIDRLTDYLRSLVQSYAGKTITSEAVESNCRTLFPDMDLNQFFELHLRNTAQYQWDPEGRILQTIE